MSSYCKGCRRPILWAEMPSGKPIPLDPTPHPKGSIALLPHDKAKLYDADDERLHRERYMPHHATCPKASDFRKASPRSSSTDRGCATVASLFALLALIGIIGVMMLLVAVATVDDLRARLAEVEERCPSDAGVETVEPPTWH